MDATASEIEKTLNGETDARIWAQEFMKLADTEAEIDEGLMIGWFANAIEAGRTAGYGAGYTEGSNFAYDQADKWRDGGN